MKKKNFVPLLGIAFVVAIVSTGIFYGLFVGRLRSASSLPETGPRVAVAARELPRGTVLKDSDLRMARWPGPLPAGSATEAAQLAGLVVTEPIHENEPVTKTRVAGKDKGEGQGMGIPGGMRAVSVHAYDSSGVLALLKPGHRVDVQVIGSGGQPAGAEPQLRTILQNMEVLAVQPQPDASPGRVPAPVVTLLATPREAAALGLADSSARIRLALRNPLDSARTDTPPMAISQLFRQALPPGEPAKASSRPVPRPAAAPAGQVELYVRLAGVGAAAMDELAARLARASSAGGETIEVAALQPGADVDQTIARLEREKTLEVLSSSRLTASHQRTVSLEADAQLANRPDGYGVRIRFAPSLETQGRVRLKVSPEVTSPLAGGSATRRIETEVEVADGQSFLVRGLLPPEAAPALWQRLFPARGDAGRQLLVLVTPRVRPAPAMAVLNRP